MYCFVLFSHLKTMRYYAVVTPLCHCRLNFWRHFQLNHKHLSVCISWWVNIGICCAVEHECIKVEPQWRHFIYQSIRGRREIKIFKLTGTAAAGGLSHTRNRRDDANGFSSASYFWFQLDFIFFIFFILTTLGGIHCICFKVCMQKSVSKEKRWSELVTLQDFRHTAPVETRFYVTAQFDLKEATIFMTFCIN